MLTIWYGHFIPWTITYTEPKVELLPHFSESDHGLQETMKPESQLGNFGLIIPLPRCCGKRRYGNITYTALSCKKKKVGQKYNYNNFDPCVVLENKGYKLPPSSSASQIDLLHME